MNALWIAYNITDGYLKNPRCYYCGILFEKSDYFNGTVHLDHFDPISKTGKHLAGNVVPACRDCNLLKSNLLDIELLQISKNPETFFTNKYLSSSDSKKEKLMDFSALFFQRIGGIDGYREKYNISINEIRSHQDKMKDNYRAKWYRN
ncbi:HNH endonuclease [Leptospira semungkisensis]|nr:HNH endonuclease signature motif containing protein [Leptospira semungkisensis]